jgi:predicted lipid-binding transport protein (Tim44 family)
MNNTIEYRQQYRVYTAQSSQTFLKPFLTAMLTILFIGLAPLEWILLLFGELHISFFIFLMMISVIYLLIKLNTDKDGYF